MIEPEEPKKRRLQKSSGRVSAERAEVLHHALAQREGGEQRKKELFDQDLIVQMRKSRQSEVRSRIVGS